MVRLTGFIVCFFLGILMSLTLVADDECSCEKIEEDLVMEKQIEENKAIVKHFLKALSDEDMASLESIMSDKLEWIIPQSPEFSPLAGSHSKQELLELYDQHHGDFPEGKQFIIKGMTAEGSRVAVEAESIGESVYGSFHNRYHFLFELEDGKIVIAKEYADSLYMNEFAKRKTKSDR